MSYGYQSDQRGRVATPLDTLSVSPKDRSPEIGALVALSNDLLSSHCALATLRERMMKLSVALIGEETENAVPELRKDLAKPPSAVVARIQELAISLMNDAAALQNIVTRLEKLV